MKIKQETIKKIEEVQKFIRDRLDYGYFEKVSYIIDEEFGDAFYFRVLIDTLGEEENDYEIGMQINMGEAQIETSEDIYEDFELNDSAEAKLWRVLFWSK